jgi:hypothetical protein
MEVECELELWPAPPCAETHLGMQTAHRGKMAWI